MNECNARPGDNCDYADHAAQKAVKKTFAILGVDIDRPEQVKEFQESLRFSDRLRKYADKGFMVLAGAVALAMAGALWVGITTKIKGGP